VQSEDIESEVDPRISRAKVVEGGRKGAADESRKKRSETVRDSSSGYETSIHCATGPADFRFGRIDRAEPD